MVSNFVYPNLVSQRLSEVLPAPKFERVYFTVPRIASAEQSASLQPMFCAILDSYFFIVLRTAVRDIQNVFHTVSFVFPKSVKLSFLETLILS